MAKEDWKDESFHHIPQGEFCVYGTVYTVPEHADKVEAVYKNITRLVEDEEGVTYYCLARDTDDPTVFHFFERYQSKQAFLQHCEQDGTQKLLNSGWLKDVKAVFVKPITP